MNRRHVIAAAATALVLTLSIPLAAFAQSGGEANTGNRPTKGSLAIVAPRQVPEGKEMSLGVFQRENQEPVPGSGVWALTVDNAGILKNNASLRDKLSKADESEYEAMLDDIGTFLGRTGGDGRLFHTFNEDGNVILLAAKKGCAPDFSPLVIKPFPVDALVVIAPRMSPPGEPVTIGVTERDGGDRVKDAGIWALTREDAEIVRGQFPSPRAAADADIAGILNPHGVFLGYTNGNGEIKYTFDNEGTFVLISFKTGFAPGFSLIAIKEAPKAMVVQAPEVASAEETVTITVSEKANGDAVKDADVWAIEPAGAEALKTKITSTPGTDIGIIIQEFGTFIGNTNGNGTVKYSFQAPGRYIIVAVGNGYLPGRTQIAIISPDAAAKAKNPRINYAITAVR